MQNAKNSPTSTPSVVPRLLFSLCMSAAIVCGIASTAMADELDALGEIPLNSGSVSLQASSARLLRTPRTPSEVQINLPIEMQNTVCVETAQVPHSGQNGAQCGYDRMVRRVCRDIPRQCHIDPRSNREVCTQAYRQCGNEFYDVARYCTWFQTECVRTEIAHSQALKKVTLKFKNLPSLRANEVEIYDLDGMQRNLDASEAVFSLSAVSTKRPVKIKARDGVFTGFKDVIIIKGD